MGSGPALCDGCKARITFVTVTKAKGGTSRMILDAQPNPAGNVAVRTSGQAKIGRVLTKGARPDSDEVIFMPHWATCPKPQSYRKRQAQADLARHRRQVRAKASPASSTSTSDQQELF